MTVAVTYLPMSSALQTLNRSIQYLNEEVPPLQKTKLILEDTAASNMIALFRTIFEPLYPQTLRDHLEKLKRSVFRPLPLVSSFDADDAPPPFTHSAPF